MLLPGVAYLIVFFYTPMLGSVMAFQDYSPWSGFLNSPWVGFDNFTFIAKLPGTAQVIRNTLTIAIAKMIGGLIVPVVFALLLNEIRRNSVKRVFQTIVYIPNFLSWIILAGIFRDILSPSDGAIGKIFQAFGLEPIFFLADKFWFPVIMVVLDIWKGFGFGTIIYLAALTSINPELYESAMIDGAGRWKQTLHITLPGITPIIVLMSVLSLGGILNAGFDQIFNMYNPIVYATGDVLDTFVFRLGLEQRKYSPAAAVGLFKSVVSLILVSFSYFLADKLANYRIF